MVCLRNISINTLHKGGGVGGGDGDDDDDTLSLHYSSVAVLKTVLPH
jgi:hypothetical protein